jgi:hypothetical protein
VIDAPLFRRAQEKWTSWNARYRWLRWTARWGVSLASLLAGIATLIVFQRGPDYFPWIVGYLLLLWVGGVVFAHLRQALELHQRRIARVALDYTLQGLHQDLLLFLLPVYYASTTLSSRNVLFLLLITAAALLTSIDPWYQASVLRYPWMAQALFAFGLFASLNVGLPLIRVRSGLALASSTFLTVLALTPAIRRRFALPWRQAALRCALGGLLGALAIWSIRDWIPPAGLYLSAATFARSVEQMTPVEPISEASAATLQAWGGLVCFTAVSAPVGLTEPIYHFWRKDGVPFARIALSPIRGGRPGGYRTYSRRSDLGSDPVGKWTVDVRTAQGQLIGRLRLRVTP